MAEGKILKLNEDQNLVFGWASVAIKDGTQIEDRQGDLIDADELEKAAYEFVLDFREADEMHDQVTKGHLVESFVTTPDKLQALGLPEGSLPVGWWVGFQLDPDAFQKVKAGQYRMFSIEGMAVREEV